MYLPILTNLEGKNDIWEMSEAASLLFYFNPTGIVSSATTELSRNLTGKVLKGDL